MWNRLLFLCLLFVFLCNSLGLIWSSRYFVQNRLRSQIKCSSIHCSPNSKEFVQKRDLKIASYFKNPSSIPTLLSLMSEFSQRSDSQCLIESYGVYLSLLLTSQVDDASSSGLINLSPTLHILTVFRRINPSKRLKFVQEVENLHNQYPQSLPHTKITSSLLFNHRRHATNCSSLTPLPPSLYQVLREAAWYGNSFKHTLLVIKRLRNLRLSKIDSRPSRTSYYYASNNGSTTGCVGFYSKLRYFEMCALFVAIKQDMQVLGGSLLDYDDSSLLFTTSTGTSIRSCGGDDYDVDGSKVRIDDTQHDPGNDSSSTSSTGGGMISTTSASTSSDMLLPHGSMVLFVLKQLLLPNATTSTSTSASSSSSFKVLPTTTTNDDDTNTTTTYSVLQHEEAFATVERFLQQYIHLHHIPQPPLHTTSSTSSTSSSSRLPSSSRTIIADDASTSSSNSNRRVIASRNEAVLVVGEGDFTFTNALLSSYSPSRSIVSTCLEKLSGRKLQEALRLKRNYPVNVTVLDEIDACNLLSSLSSSGKLPLGGRRFFDAIYFTFPYANTNHIRGLPASMSNDTNNTPKEAFDSHYLGIRRHSELLQSFLVSAKDVLAEHGEVVLMGLLSQWVAWELEHLLDMQGFVLSSAYGFDYELWRGRGYVPKRTHGLDSFVPKTQKKSIDNTNTTTSSSTSNDDKDDEDVAYVVHLVRKK